MGYYFVQFRVRVNEKNEQFARQTGTGIDFGLLNVTYSMKFGIGSIFRYKTKASSDPSIVYL